MDALSNINLSASSNATFTITTTSSTTGTFWINADTGMPFEDPIETMKRELAILVDKFLEKYHN